GTHHGSQPSMGANEVGAFHRQQVEITPHTARPLFDLLAGDGFLDLLVVVLHFERTEAHFAYVGGFCRVLFPALAADQRFHFGHDHTTLRVLWLRLYRTAGIGISVVK